MKRDHPVVEIDDWRLRVSRKRRIFRRQQRRGASDVDENRAVATKSRADDERARSIRARPREQDRGVVQCQRPSGCRIARLKSVMIGAQAQQRAVERERAGVIRRLRLVP